jgi:hypothetical protein
MSRGAGAPRSGDATPRRDEGALPAVAGVPCAGRSRYAGSSADAPARPPRSGDATGELPQATDGMVSGYYPTLWRWQA